MAKKSSGWLPLFCLLTFSLGLRLYHLGYQSYWIDEMVSLYFGYVPGWRNVFMDNHPFLYHLLLKFWIFLFGFSEASTRLLSVIFSVTTTYVIYLTALRIFKRPLWGYLAGFMHAISVFSIIYAQETRMYALFELASAVNILFFYETFFENKKPRNFYLSCALLALTHYGALFVFLIEAVFVMVTKAKNAKVMYTALVGGVAIAAVSYFFNFSWFHLEWQKFKYTKELTSRTPVEGLLHFSNLSFLLLTMYIVLIIYTFVSVKKDKDGRRVFFFLEGMIVYTVLILGMVTQITQRSLLLPRYLVFLNPAWILLFIYCLYALPKKALKPVGGAFIVVSLLFVPKAYYNLKAPWKDAADYISETSGSSVVLTTRTLAIAFPYLYQKGISVQKLEPKDVASVKKYFPKFESVWILENYWGSQVYFENLERDLRNEGYGIIKREFTTGISEPLQLLRITPPKK